VIDYENFITPLPLEPSKIGGRSLQNPKKKNPILVGTFM
jgi:hypothetical protein